MSKFSSVKTNPGYMIAVEGADKAGKRTQVMNIVNYLNTRGILTETLDFPQYDSPVAKKLIIPYLNGDFGPIRDVAPEITMPMYTIDRVLCQPDIKKWLNDGKWVILDRYSYSNSFSVAKRPKTDWDRLIEYMETLEFDWLGLQRPDYNIYLYLDPKIAFNMRNHALKKHQDGKPDMHECDFQLLYDVSDVYRKIAAGDPENWTVVDEMKSNGERMDIPEVFAKIKPVIDDLISQWQGRGNSQK